MSFACLACRSTRGEPYLEKCRDLYLGKPAVVDYVRCAECRLVQQSPVPGDVSSFYDDYPIHRKKSALHEALRRVLVGGLYYPLGAHAPGAVLVDYGCGDGGYLARWKDRGYVLAGFEPDPSHARRLAEELGLDVASNREALAKYRGKADVVTMHFVFEHVTDLHATLADAALLLKPGGTLWIVVPRISSFEARLFGRAWHNLDAPRHVSFPEPDVMRKIGAAHGLQLESMRSIPFANGFAGSIPVVLTGKFRTWLFALALPAGVLFSRISRGGAIGYRLSASGASA